MTETKGAIIRAIRVAFAGVRRGKITLHEAEVIDAYGYDHEREVARKIDSDRDWTQIPDTNLAECPYALTYLDPESWRYYIPAHMIRVLETPDCAWGFKTFDSLFSPYGEVPEFLLAQYRSLSLEQSQAVYRFLKIFEAENDFAAFALEQYWKKFEMALKVNR